MAGRPLKFLIAQSLAEEAPQIAELLQQGGYDTEWIRAGAGLDLPEALTREPWDLLFPDYRRQLHAINAELRDKIQQLELSNADLEQFAWAASHDLKEPLRTISSYTQLLIRRGPAAEDAQAAEFALYIQRGVARMGDLIDALLAYSRAMYQPLGPSHVTDAHAAADEAAQTLRVAIEESGAMLHIDPLPPVRAELAPLVQIFQNLLANALKYRDPKAPPAIVISAGKSGGEIRFSVRDNGIGISAEHYSRIFEVFRRLHGEDYEGLGIGLAICKRLVERSGGRIWLESEPGIGSTFYFTLPAAEAARSASANV